MIDKQPAPGDLTDWLMEPYEARDTPSPMLHDATPARVSSVLGPDGEPVMVDTPRRRMGFVLTPKSITAKEVN
jgi:hypothetical protein